MFGQRLKETRKAHHYTLESLAEAYNARFAGGGLSKGTLSKYENEKQEPLSSVVGNLAELLGVTTDYLLGRTDHSLPPAPDNQLFAAYGDVKEALDDADLDDIALFMRSKNCKAAPAEPASSAAKARRALPGGDVCMDTAALRACYARLEAMGVDVFTCPMQNHKALCSPDGALALNPAAIESGAEEQAILLHEEGHFATGAFYTVQSPYTIRQKQENIANRYIYKRYFPPQRLQSAMAAGLREPWQLAEYFDLPEAMIREMLDYYQAQGLLELCPEEEL